jgi:HEAT repeat protein
LQLSLDIAVDNDPATRLANAVKLVSIGTPDAVKAVLTIIDTKNNHAAKLAVCQAIAQVKAVEPAYKPYLIKMLSHSEIAVQKAAYAALTNYADPDVAATLQTYRRQERQRLLEEALTRNAKARYEETEAAKRPDLLIEWLTSPLPIEQMIAMDYIHADLLKGNVPAQLDQIRSLLGSPDVDVRLEAILIIRDCHEVADAQLIRGLLEKKDQPIAIREAAYNTLGKLADPSSLQACIAGLNDAVETVAAEAAGALGRLMELKTGITSESIETATKALLTRAGKPMTNARLRENMLDAMATIGDKAFVPIMVDHVGTAEPDPAVRQAAIRGLGKIADASHAKLIRDQLADADAGVRTSAVGAVELIFKGQVAAGKKKDAAATLESAIRVIPVDQVDLQTRLATELIALYFSNPSPKGALTCAVNLQPKTREAVADQFHKYATQLGTTDPTQAIAFLDELKQRIPDQFGATWEPKFTTLRSTLQSPATRPATTPAS